MLDEIRSTGSNHDNVRRKYLQNLQHVTGRNVIIYYSGWLQKPKAANLGLNDNDITGFMTAIHGLDRTKGLDLVLHTPGGETATTEALVDYLRKMFGNDIRAIIPQLAMSAGTMVACSCKKIVMGKHSSLGPIDPQLPTIFGNLPVHGIIEEFNNAKTEVKKDPSTVPIWQPIIAKYNPTLIGECQKSIAWSNQMVKDWLTTGMLSQYQDRDARADTIIKELGDHSYTLSHSRHLSAQKCRDMGLDIEFLEANPALQDAVLSVHHAAMQTLMHTGATKIIENHNGVAYIEVIQNIIIGQLGQPIAPQ